MPSANKLTIRLGRAHITSVMVVVALLGLLAGCSGSGNTGGASTTGFVVGSYFRNALVCLDVNNNGVCEPGEPATVTNSAGQFTLAGSGSAIVADVGAGATRLDPDTQTWEPVTRRIVLRAPKEATGIVSVFSTAVVSEMESASMGFADALNKVAKATGVTATQLMGDFNKEPDAHAKATLTAASSDGLDRIQLALANAKPSDNIRNLLAGATGTLDRVRNVVVIYLENRSFDNLYGLFPGANGVANASNQPANLLQYDRDGLTPLPKLPTVWNASTDPAWFFVAGLPNKPFLIDAAPGESPGKTAAATTPDLVHRFYQHQMQINGWKNNQFAAWSDAGGLTMGYYDGSTMKLWGLARQFALADNYFQGAFGGSFLNHFWLVCACSPVWPNPPAANIAAVDPTGTRLLPAPNMPVSALNGPPAYVADGNVTPKLADGNHYGVNTAQPPYQPSQIPPEAGGDWRLANPASPAVLPPQSALTIGDTLTAKNIPWKWYAAGWDQALAASTSMPRLKAPDIVTHHQPFNYFRRFDPTTAVGQAERAAHLKDYNQLLTDIQTGSLPPVSFYKPSSSLNQHPGDSAFAAADAHVAELVTKLQASPQWKGMVIVVTYDEYGGFWDHVPPPKGDAWGPGSRVPAIIISSFGKQGYVDSVPYDVTSIAKFLTRRFGLSALPGVRKQAGDLSQSLNLIP